MVARPAGNRQRVVAALDGQARTFDEKGEGSIAVRLSVAAIAGQDRVED
jgi:hypothetical protein